MAGRLDGKIALISGGAGGCGLAATELFAREGAAVGIVDLPQSDGEAIAARLRSEGFRAAFASADVSDERQVTQAVEGFRENSDRSRSCSITRAPSSFGRFWRPRSTSGTG